MGVAWEGCPVVAELLGMKLFLNDGRRGVGRFQEAVDLFFPGSCYYSHIPDGETKT